MSFSTLGLNPALLDAVARAGYQEPTPIQNKAIPAVLSGADVLAAAQTGTGKTAAFTLPILERLGPTRRASKRPSVLVLTPTRELAAQVGESFATYGADTPLRSLIIFGGVGAEPQIRALRQGTDVLIATPGRLLDLAQQGHLHLNEIDTFVMDEADRMLDMGFIHDIKRVIKLLPAKRQNLMFSATFSPEIRELAKRIVHQPVEIDVSPRNSATKTVSQRMIRVAKDQKRELLAWLIGRHDWHQVLVFTRTKHGANRLCQQLEKDGLESAAIHGNKSQGARTKALDAFKNRKLRVLVATDIAARGIDIDQLPHVINYELPMVAEDYVHRIGRTGRAGSSGEALSLISSDENKQYRAITKLLGKDIPLWDISDEYHLRAEKPGGPDPDVDDRPPRGNPRGRPGAKSAPSRGAGQPAAKRPPQARGTRDGGSEQPGNRRRRRRPARSSN